MDITPSARKHGLSDDAIRHVWEFAIAVRCYEYDWEDRLLVIGPTLTGELVELVAVPAPSPSRIIHADRLRPTFYKYL